MAGRDGRVRQHLDATLYSTMMGASAAVAAPILAKRSSDGRRFGLLVRFD